jgi:hypothetical protein
MQTPWLPWNSNFQDDERPAMGRRTSAVASGEVSSEARRHTVPHSRTFIVLVIWVCRTIFVLVEIGTGLIL